MCSSGASYVDASVLFCLLHTCVGIWLLWYIHDFRFIGTRSIVAWSFLFFIFTLQYDIRYALGFVLLNN